MRKNKTLIERRYEIIKKIRNSIRVPSKYFGKNEISEMSYDHLKNSFKKLYKQASEIELDILFYGNECCGWCDALNGDGGPVYSGEILSEKYDLLYSIQKELSDRIEDEEIEDMVDSDMLDMELNLFGEKDTVDTDLRERLIKTRIKSKALREEMLRRHEKEKELEERKENFYSVDETDLF